MPRAAQQLRLFVAIHPPPELIEQLLAALDRLELPPHRRTPADRVHITAQFIGDVPACDRERTIESVRCAAAGVRPMTLAVRGWMVVPTARAARLIAVETDAPSGLLELKHRLVTRLAQHPRRPDRRPFRPHLTLCRFKGTPRIDPPTTPLPRTSFDVSALSLMSSKLHPDGAHHREIASIDLH